jgi:hypothetical protein
MEQQSQIQIFNGYVQGITDTIAEKDQKTA